MQCPNCQFECLPGLSACARCGSPLSLDHVCIEPTRASALRLGTRATRALNRTRASFPTLGRWAAALRRMGPHPASGRALLLSSLIPGLGHLRLGHRVYGWILLGGWLVALLSAGLAFGSAWAWYLFSFAVTFHAASIVSLLDERLLYASWLARIALGVGVYLLVLFVVYRPLTGVGATFACPVQVANIGPGSNLETRDTVLVAGTRLRPERFERGDVCLYDLRPWSGGNFVIPAGVSVDRVVGLPGEQLAIEAGRLLLNGQPAPIQPLGEIPRSLKATFHLRPHEYLILPTLLRFNMLGNMSDGILADAFRAVAVVREDEIRGRVIARVRPPLRFDPVE